MSTDTMTTDTTMTDSHHWLARLGDDRRKMLKVLAKAANWSHRRAAASAGAAVYHTIGAGKVPGGRAREGSLHGRLGNFHIGGEWFHLTPGVRAVIRAVIADDAD